MVLHPSCPCSPVGCAGGAAPTPLWSKGSQCNRVLAPSTGMDTARHGSAVHATQWCTSSLCPSSRHPGCRASESQFGQSVSVFFVKGQAGALGAVFLWFLVRGTYSPPPYWCTHLASLRKGYQLITLPCCSCTPPKCHCCPCWGGELILLSSILLIKARHPRPPPLPPVPCRAPARAWPYRGSFEVKPELLTALTD